MENVWEEYRKKIIGLGDNSIKKSYYPELQEKIESLELIQKNLETIIDRTSDGIVIHNMYGKIIYSNSQAQKILHFSAKEQKSLFLQNITINELNRSELLHFWKDLQNCPPNGVEWTIKQFITKEERIVRISFSNVLWHEQSLILSTIQDITRQKKHEVDLQKSIESYKSLFELAADGILVGNSYGKIIDANDSFCILSGYTKKEILGQSINLFFSNEELQKNPFQYDALNQGKTVFNERILTKKNGTWAYVQMNSKRLPDGRLQAVFRDVTNIKKTEEELKKSEERFESALKAVNEGIWEWDIKSNNLYLDTRFYNMAGYTPFEFPNEFVEWKKRVHINDIEVTMLELQNHLQGKTENYDVEFRFLRKDKSWMWIRSRGKAIKHDPSGNVLLMIGTHSDITDRKLVEQELKKHKDHLESLVIERTHKITQLNKDLNNSNKELHNQKNKLEGLLEELKTAQEQLIQSEKLASIGVLTAGIAHEINNPINFISSGAVGLEMELENLIAAHKEYDKFCSGKDNTPLFKINKKFDVDQSLKNIPLLISSIKTGVERTTNIVKGLRTFSRLDSENKSEANINELIDSALTILYNKYKTDITIEKNYCNNANVICFPGKLGQVFLNILSNAIQSIDGNGKIIITTKLFTENKILKVTFNDTGCGIPNEKLSKIFDPFYTTKQVGQGTGLGLPIVLGIIKDHQGTIEVESKVGMGTTFIISLPISPK